MSNDAPEGNARHANGTGPWTASTSNTLAPAWHPIPATLASIAIVALSFALALVPIALMSSVNGRDMNPLLLLSSLVISQIVMGVGAWWLAGQRGGERPNVLSLGPMRVSRRQALMAVIAMFAVTGGYQTIRHVFLGHDIFADMKTMAPLFRGSMWPLTVVAVSLVAPLAEELLFRGFLLSAYSRSNTAFWMGVMLSTAIWTALHVQYQLPALMLVGLMGIIFSVMLKWSGSLRLPIMAHILNNTAACAYILIFLKE